MNLNRKRSRVFYGWYIVSASLLVSLFTNGVVGLGFTAVIRPIAEELGWSYAQISIAASLRGLEVGLLAPVMGLLVDRWGPRRLVAGGSFLICLGFIVLSRVSSLPMFYGAFALIAIGMSSCTQTVLVTAVANWFRKRAGTAIGIAVSGVGLGGLLVPVVTKLIDTLQWRTAMFVVGMGILFIVLPLSFILRHKPEQYGYRPDGEISSVVEIEETNVITSRAEVNISPVNAIRNRAFWAIGIASLSQAFVVGSILTHIMPYLSSLGIVRSLSSLVALAIPVASIGGRLSSGWLAARLGSRQTFAAGFVSITIGMLFLGYVTPGIMWLLAPFIITFSFGWGNGATTRLSLLREYFGRGSFGTILGFTLGIMMLGNIAGAPVAGWIFDTWGSYKGAWLGFSSITLVGAILALTLPDSSSTTIHNQDPMET